MNLLMILLIVLAIWICAAICFFAWRIMPKVQAERPGEADRAGDSKAHNDRPGQDG